MLITSLHLDGVEIASKVMPFQEIARDEWNHETLLFTMCHLFSCYSNGYLGRGLECWAVSKRDKAFYLFDPLGMEFKEKSTCRRRAVLYKFARIESLVEQMFECVKNEDSEQVTIGVIVSCPLSSQPTTRKIADSQKPEKEKKTKKCTGHIEIPENLNAEPIASTKQSKKTLTKPPA